MATIDRIMEAYDKLHKCCNGNINQEKQFVEKMHELTVRMIQSLPWDKKIAIRPFSETAQWLIDHFDFEGREVICLDRKPTLSEYHGIHLYKTDEVDRNDLFVINVSFQYRKEINDDLQKKEMNFIDLYSVYENGGVQLRTIPPLYRETTHAIPNYYWNNFGENKSDENLKMLLTACVEAFDFALLEKICKEYESKSYVSKVYNLYRELENEMCLAINERRDKKDVWLYWVDAVPYKWRDKLPFIEDLSKNALSFENVYTTTPFTHQAFRAMFGEILPLDNFEESQKRFNEDNDLIKYLIEHGYDFLQIGCDGYVNFTCIDELLINLDRHVSCNYVYWKTFCKMIASEKPVFYIAHSIIETHPEMLCTELNNFNYYINISNYKEQRDISYKYIDARLKYWVRMLSNQYQIVLSDHGEHISEFPGRFWTQSKLHTWCMIVAPDIEKKVENRMFSYLNFSKLIKYLLNDDCQYDDLFSDYVLFQDTDYFDEKTIKHVCKNGISDYFVAYRGVFDGTYKYVINGKQQEFFYKIENDEDIEIDFYEDASAFEELKQVAGNSFPDVSNVPKFKYCKMLYG